jgi:AcrR family transcriptional regulator
MSDTAGTPPPGRGSVRERILEAALAILREDGIHEVSQVQVARRAGVRQSHLTYYFPRRHDLVSAVTERVADGIAGSARPGLAESEADDVATMLPRLLETIAQREHMRMFLGALAESDRDPEVQAILLRQTERVVATLAAALGGENATERARLVLASLWGLGLYAFLTGAPASTDTTFLIRLAGIESGR